MPIYRIKLIVFVFSGFTAGIAGALYSTSQSYITPDAFIVNLGMFFFVSIVIGGRGVILGPFVGAAVLTAIPELVGPLAKYASFFYGVVLLTVVLAMPGGVERTDPHARPSASAAAKTPRPASSPDLETLRRAIRPTGEWSRP